MKKTIIIFLISFLLLINIFVLGCINFGDNNNSNNNERDWYQSGEYILEITPNKNENYNVTVPLLVNQNGTLSEIMYNLKFFEGKGDFEIVDTDKGTALRILANSKIIIKGIYEKTKGKDDIVWDVLSFEKDTVYDGKVNVFGEDLSFWVKLENQTNIDNLQINITFNASQSNDLSGSDALSECQGIIYPNDDWQILTGFRKVKEWDK